MSNNSVDPPWVRAGWIEQAGTWIHTQLERLGIDITGTIEQPHVRAWSTVLRVPTTSGAIYFKAITPILTHEVRLTQTLARWRPDVMLPLHAVHLQRGWMLMPDGGTRLRETLKAEPDLRHWERVLPIYAELQIELAQHVTQLLNLGAPDRRVATLPAQYERLLNGTAAACVNRPDGLTPKQHRRLRDHTATLATLCKQLSGYRIPESLHHGDLHDGNIFLAGDRYIFFDWGDCSITHPFVSLRTVFVSAENTLQLNEDAPELDRLRDAYLEPWTRYETRDNLLTAFKLAQRIAPVVGALTWDRIVSNVEPQARAEYIYTIPSLLQEFLSMQQ